MATTKHGEITQGMNRASPGGDRRSPAAELRARQIEARVVELRLKGTTFMEIGNQTGLSESGAYRAWERALDNLPKPAAERARVALLEELALLRAEAWRTIKDPDTGRDTRLRALVVLLRCNEREAQLCGADVPQRLALGLGFVDPNAETEAALLDNLSTDEMRTLLALSRKARGLPAEPMGEYVNLHREGQRAAAPLTVERRTYRPGDPGYEEVLARINAIKTTAENTAGEAAERKAAEQAPNATTKN